MTSKRSIKDLINNDYVIILDTNVLLGVYKYSYDYSLFAYNCLCFVKGNIVLPSTVYIEYLRNRIELYGSMRNRVKRVKEDT